MYMHFEINDTAYNFQRTLFINISSIFYKKYFKIKIRLRTKIDVSKKRLSLYEKYIIFIYLFILFLTCVKNLLY